MRAGSSERFFVDRLKTPIGIAVLAVDDEGYLRAFDWADYGDRQLRLLRRFSGEVSLVPGAAPSAMRETISAYFDGDLAAIGKVPWRTGGTSFQRACWRALCDIPPGTTSTYAHHAATVGRPRAFRAVGAANGANPVGVVVPCHRLVGADGALTGYGGGLWRKRWLLRHEGTSDVEDEGFADHLKRALTAA